MGHKDDTSLLSPQSGYTHHYEGKQQPPDDVHAGKGKVGSKVAITKERWADSSKIGSPVRWGCAATGGVCGVWGHMNVRWGCAQGDFVVCGTTCQTSQVGVSCLALSEEMVGGTQQDSSFGLKTMINNQLAKQSKRHSIADLLRSIPGSPGASSIAALGSYPNRFAVVVDTIRIVRAPCAIRVLLFSTCAH